jgi:hypothetical protein
MDSPELINKLKNCMLILERIKKEILSADVAGLGLVRQDLGIRLANRKPKKRNDIVYGQKHKTPEKKPHVTMTGGMGRYPQSEIPVE